ncbi:hypothetical protein CK486_11295 [Pseudomonas sp. HAR-UPW-AIA-41]|uniref:hypothetical protein n=1 Tax=Pseudomonas sp. HAR-UPW-AIA-41 TaxID=1985301 RepID=UPI000BB3C4E2|nr:hypothetical protein [Pseudomonas sp. HAR-UPW-AIA-41]PAV47641.1 hypothetical protein CK486_11295 [Pseudomonas sp. HAR-UPW-AIA-41]
MGAHDWARGAIDKALHEAREVGLDEALVLRALLSALVERSKVSRPLNDLAQELQFLAENLDDGRDYMFMRP